MGLSLVLFFLYNVGHCGDCFRIPFLIRRSRWLHTFVDCGLVLGSGEQKCSAVGVCPVAMHLLVSSGIFQVESLTLSVLLVAASLSGCSTPSLRTVSVPATGATVLTPGQTVQFHRLDRISKAHIRRRRRTSRTACWSSSTPSVATIDSTGVATAVGSGTTTITAVGAGAFGAIQGTSNVQVNLSATPPSGLSSISIIPTSQPITVLGQTAKFVAIGNYTGVSPATQDLTTQVSWSSSAPGVATITSGAAGGIAAVGPGTATITATGQSSSGATISVLRC